MQVINLVERWNRNNTRRRTWNETRAFIRSQVKILVKSEYKTEWTFPMLTYQYSGQLVSPSAPYYDFNDIDYL